MYAIYNKGTDVIEYRTGNLPDGVNQLAAFQSALNAAKSGAQNVEFVQ